MGQHIVLHWEGTLEGMTRRERLPVDYAAYLPDSLQPIDSAGAQRGINSWIATFAGACRRATQHVAQFAQQARPIEQQWQQQWRAKFGPIRAKSTIALLLPKLLGAPVLTVHTAAELTSRSFQRANVAMARLCEAGILRQLVMSGVKRNRAFEAPSVLVAFKQLERSIASAPGDTRIEPPTRPVPLR